jgi:hypothetical protein
MPFFSDFDNTNCIRQLRYWVAGLFKFFWRAAKSGEGPPHSKTLARNPTAPKPRAASWTAPVLWRFGDMPSIPALATATLCASPILFPTSDF